MESFRRGAEDAQRARQTELERERIQAEIELYRAQAQAAREGVAKTEVVTPRSATPPAQSDYLQRWRAATLPRKALFLNFDQVVFASDVSITPDMMMLMTSSEFAADIAYYLATHKAEALAISRLPLLDAARAIDKIEGEVKAVGSYEQITRFSSQPARVTASVSAASGVSK